MIAICSPASAVAPATFAAGIQRLETMGVPFKVMPHAQGRVGTYSAPLAERIADMAQALADPEVDAILCGRGGYGAVQMLEAIAPHIGPAHPKWLIGFSDITALHALWGLKGCPSIHAPMLRALALSDDGAPWGEIEKIMRTGASELAWDAHPLNRPGNAEGRVVGGNLSVLMGLYGTPYFPVRPGDILVIEDICEPIYKIERMLWQLRLGGTLQALGALIVGQFTHTDPDENYHHPYDMIAEMTAPYAYPVAYGAPIGHSWPNRPFLYAPSRFSASAEVVKLLSC